MPDCIPLRIWGLYMLSCPEAMGPIIEMSILVQADEGSIVTSPRGTRPSILSIMDEISSRDPAKRASPL